MEKDRSIYSDILSIITTVSQATAVCDAIDNTIASLYQKDSKSEDVIKTMFDGVMAEKIVVILRQEKMESVDAIREFLLGLQERLTKAKVIRVILAITPDKEIVSIFSAWVQAQFGKTGILLAFERDPNIISGVVVIYEGRYIDVSLKKSLEEWFVNKGGTQPNTV